MVTGLNDPRGIAVIASTTTPPPPSGKPVLTGSGTATINGIESPGEWGNAGCASFPVNLPGGGTTPGTVCAMNDATNLYLLVRFARTLLDPGNTASFEFDNDHDGVWPENGDDILLINPSIGFFDEVRTTAPPCPGGAFCGFFDTSAGGTNDGSGAFSNNGTSTVYEFSHPLNSADNANDFSLNPGGTVGFRLFIRMIGPGGMFPRDFGDTSFPSGGFGDIVIATSPNRSPVANAGPDQTVSVGATCQASVTLNGTSSSDPDGDSLSFQWANASGTNVGSSADVNLNLPLGSHTFTLTVSDGKGGTASDSVTITVRDTTPPSTIATRPAPNGNGWYNSNVQVTLTASDNCSVKEISYSLGGAQTGAAVVAGSSASVAISAEGRTTLTYFARDNAGNQEASRSLSVQIDKTPPNAPAAHVSPVANAAGWNNSTPVTASFTTNGDPGSAASGVASCTSPTTLNNETAGTVVSGTCTDRAGNTSTPASVTVKIDKTPPTLACGANPNTLWPPNHRMVPVTATVAVNDPLSGPAGFLLLSVTSNEPDNGLGDGDMPEDIQGFLVGTADTSGLLRAERSGMGNGRIYTLTYRGKDAAGNSATCAATVTVSHDQ